MSGRRGDAASSFLLLAACCAGHAGLTLAVPDPWLAPNLTVVGLVLAAAGSPERWLPCSAVAALCSLVWAVRFPIAVGGGYLAVGWLLHWVAGQWDAADPRVQSGLVGVSSALLTVGSLWLHDLWSLPVAGLALVQIAVTYGAFLLVRRFANTVRKPVR
jgi:hypothetical protein